MTESASAAAAGHAAPTPGSLFEEALSRWQTDDFDGAEALARQVIEMDPSHSPALHLLGTLLSMRDDHAGALTLIDRALALDPHHPVLHLKRGDALTGLARHEEAVAAYRQSFAANPEDPRARNNLGVALFKSGQSGEAEELFRELVKARPDDAEARYNLGLVLAVRPEADDETEALFLEAVRLAPDYAAAYDALAIHYETRNRTDAAWDVVERGLKLNPESMALLDTSAKLCRRSGDHATARRHLEQAIATARAAGRGEAESVLLHQLALTLDALDETDAAFELFQRVNGEQSAALSDPDAKLAEFPARINKLATAFTPQWTARWEPIESAPEQPPIFLFGFARSGTTLLDTLLGAHPDLEVLEEKLTTGALVAALQALPGGEIEALRTLTAQQQAALQQAYRDKARESVPLDPRKRLLDKAPFNTINAGILHRVFPGAPLIFALRHPCDVVLSCYMQYFKPNSVSVHFYSLDRAARVYAELMSLWRRYREVLPLNVHLLRYEDLVRDTEGEMRRLLDFAGLEWSDAVLDNVDQSRKRTRVMTPSYSQINRPIYTDASYRWQRYRKYLEPVLETLAPWVEYFGYDPL